MKKALLLVFTSILLCNLVQAKKRAFLRVYNVEGHKFSKGYLAGTTDSSVFILRHGDTVEIRASNIGFIKTGRSVGYDLLLGELTGAVPFMLLGFAFDDANGTFPLITGVGFVIGSILGLSSGTIVAGLKQTHKFTISGDINNWHLQRPKIDFL